jgi:hypothetical protein
VRYRAKLIKTRPPTKKHHKQVRKAPTKARNRKTGINYRKTGIIVTYLPYIYRKTGIVVTFFNRKTGIYSSFLVLLVLLFGQKRPQKGTCFFVGGLIKTSILK